MTGHYIPSGLFSLWYPFKITLSSGGLSYKSSFILKNSAASALVITSVLLVTYCKKLRIIALLYSFSEFDGDPKILIRGSYEGMVGNFLASYILNSCIYFKFLSTVCSQAGVSSVESCMEYVVPVALRSTSLRMKTLKYVFVL